MSEAIRRDAVTCALAAIAAVDPGDLVRSALQRGGIIGNVSLVAVGKAAGTMMTAGTENPGLQVLRGVVISREPVRCAPNVSCYVGGHPVPNDRGAEGARAVLQLAQSLLSDDDTLLCLVSGGASSLMALPADGLTVVDFASTTSLLLRAGATIQDMNCVRKHIDQLKGGRLATAAFPARVVSLVLSDVVGDSLSTIASGPTVGDPTTITDAILVLKKYRLWDVIPVAVRAHLQRGADESPKPGDPRLALAESRIIGSNITAAEAACAQARLLGYEARIATTSMTGEASKVGAEIVGAIREECERTNAPVALVYAGETTVTVRGNGVGGRNQELALGAAIAMDGMSGIAVASLGTDGIDGPTDAAGAVADGESIQRGRTRGRDPVAALAANDTYNFWKSLGALVRTGPTGTNVMDIVVATARPVTV